jgi:F0F1-type ATP synthase assembly protein I
VSEHPDDRSPQAIAYHWASRILTVSMEMVIPGLLGYGIDRWLDLRAAFMPLGFIIGLVLGMWHLLQMVRADASQ